jgi:hypothetical protein
MGPTLILAMVVFELLVFASVGSRTERPSG